MGFDLGKGGWREVYGSVFLVLSFEAFRGGVERRREGERERGVAHVSM